MRLSCLGACREIGRSSFLLEDEAGQCILLDCGIKQWKQNLPPLDPPRKPTAIILSHSHLDHCGGLPIPFKHGNPLVYCTPPAAEVTEVLLEDTLKIARQENTPAPFSKADAKKAMKAVSVLPFEKERKLEGGTSFEFFDAGHITGSAQVLLRCKKSGRRFNMLYSGDFNTCQTQLQEGASPPAEKIDVLVVESTYAEREHPPRQRVEKEFAQSVQDAVDEGGTVLVPCFAVERTAEILMVLNQAGLNAPVYLDGLGQRICGIMRGHPDYVRNCDAMLAAFERARFVEDRPTQRRIAEEPGVIIATAGMLEGGPAMDYLQKINEGKRPNAVFLTGYQVKGTNGHRLATEGKIKTKKGSVSINIAVRQFDFS
ncbi:MAG: MBL fold metallo-hydrolase, partial [Candidatus Micrarchaeota archaeon]